MPTYYDIHCHLFNKDIISERLLDLLLPILMLFDREDDGMVMKKVKFKLTSIVDMLEIVNVDTSREVFQVLDEAYDSNVVTTPLMFDLTFADRDDASGMSEKRYRRRQKLALKVIRGIRVTALAQAAVDPEMDALLRREIKGRPILKYFEHACKEARLGLEIFEKKNYEQQWTSLESMATDPALGGRVRPFFGVDPRRYKSRPALVKEVKAKCTGPGAKWAGVKLYAPAGFSPTDPLLYGTKSNRLGLYRFCEENNIPITVHCSNSGFSTLADTLSLSGHVKSKYGIKYFYRKKHTFEKKFFTKFGAAIHERAEFLNHPTIWKLVFERYPNLKLNLAHLGGSTPIMDYVHKNLELRYYSKKDLRSILIRCDGPQEQIVKESLSESGKYWKVRFPYKYVSGESQADYDARARFWKVLFDIGILDNWALHILNIVSDQAYPNAYTDLSCFCELNETVDPHRITDALSNFKSDVYDKLNPYQKSKILYGSDFWLNVMQGTEMRQYYNDFKDVFGSAFNDIASNHPEKFLGIN